MPRRNRCAGARSWLAAGLIATLGAACTGPAPDLSEPPPARDIAVGETLERRSGLEYTQLRAGFGDRPTALSTVRVHYEGTLENGTVFDSSIERSRPAKFSLDQVIACWTEGIQLMREGSQARLVCPGKIAYGSRGRPPTIPPNATLIFEVELLQIVR